MNRIQLIRSLSIVEFICFALSIFLYTKGIISLYVLLGILLSVGILVGIAIAIGITILKRNEQ